MISRAIEWLGIAAGVGVWAAGLMIAGPAASEPEADRAASAAMLDPMFVREVSAPPAVVEGRVVDTEGHPVRGAIVYVYRDQREGAAGDAVTDCRGRFHLDHLTPGLYSFVAIYGQRPAGARADVPIHEDSGDVEIVLDQEPVGA